jgi:hypothetical protein
MADMHCTQNICERICSNSKTAPTSTDHTRQRGATCTQSAVCRRLPRSLRLLSNVPWPQQPMFVHSTRGGRLPPAYNEALVQNGGGSARLLSKHHQKAHVDVRR